MWVWSGECEGLRSEQTVTRWCLRDGPHQAAGGPWGGPLSDRSLVMTLPRSAAEVLSEHVIFSLECIDRVYLNLFQPRLQTELGLVGYLRGRLDCQVASTAPLGRGSEAFATAIGKFIAARGVPLVAFAKGQRKDDVMAERLAAFEASGRTEGVVFVGRVQEKNRVFR